eukprot:gene5720-6615_t
MYFTNGTAKTVVDLSYNKLSDRSTAAYCQSTTGMLNIYGNNFHDDKTKCNPLGLFVIAPARFPNNGQEFRLSGSRYSDPIHIYDEDRMPLSCSYYSTQVTRCQYNKFTTSPTGKKTLYYGPDQVEFNLLLESPIVYDATTVSSTEGGEITIKGYNFPELNAQDTLLVLVDEIKSPLTGINISLIETPTINTRMSVTTLNLTISMESIMELDIDGNVVKIVTLDNVWSGYDDIDDTEYNFSGSIHNTTTRVAASIKVYLNDSTYTFGNEVVDISANSIKFSFNISKWEWVNDLNTLQVIYTSSIVQGPESELPQSSGCSTNVPVPSPTTPKHDALMVANTTTRNTTSISSTSYVNRGIVVNTKFSSGAYVDGRFISVHNSIDSYDADSIRFAIKVPHFLRDVTIDPDWSVFFGENSLIDQGGALITGLTIYIRIKIKQRAMALKLSQLSDRFKNQRALSRQQLSA